MRRRCCHRDKRYILQRHTGSLEVILLDRESKTTYTKNLCLGQWKKFFQRENYVWQDEQEAHKDGRIMSYRDGMETWEVSHSKERRNLGWVVKIYYRG